MRAMMYYNYTTNENFNKLEELESNPDVVIKPIYMYDHSGQTIRLTPFGDPWDSGVCGYIYAKKKLLKRVAFLYLISLIISTGILQGKYI